MRKRRPTQADVAARANVSPAIVSLVINGRVNGNVRVSAETQQRVWDAVREMGYVANPVARKLAGSQNRLLGVFTYETIFPLAHHDFYYPFLEGIEEEAQVQNYDLLLFTRTDPNGERSIYKDGVNSLQIADGAILLGTHKEYTELPRLLDEEYPFVFVGKRQMPDREISYVAADYVTATREVISYILGKGHHRIAYLHQAGRIAAQEEREAGFRLAHEEKGIPYLEALCRPHEKEEITPALLQQYLAAGMTALVTDHTNLPLLQKAIAALGMRIPQDLSLAVLGDPLNDVRGLTAVTGFSIPRPEMGRQAVRLLIDLLSDECGPSPRHITLPCTFVEGETVIPFSAREEMHIL
jgi:DNA-binding LacI/PurR family transcriptional regulator